MARSKKLAVPMSAMTVMEYQAPPDPPIRQQSRHSDKPWCPGEIPADPLMVISRRHNSPRTPYGHGALGIELPSNVGSAFPLKMDVENSRGESPWAEGGDQLYTGQRAIKSNRTSKK